MHCITWRITWCITLLPMRPQLSLPKTRPDSPGHKITYINFSSGWYDIFIYPFLVTKHRKARKDQRKHPFWHISSDEWELPTTRPTEATSAPKALTTRPSSAYSLAQLSPAGAWGPLSFGPAKCRSSCGLHLHYWWARHAPQVRYWQKLHQCAHGPLCACHLCRSRDEHNACAFLACAAHGFGLYNFQQQERTCDCSHRVHIE